MHLLTSLRKLATGGRAVITTIHQPSSRLYQQLDKLLLLSKGCVLRTCTPATQLAMLSYRKFWSSALHQVTSTFICHDLLRCRCSDAAIQSTGCDCACSKVLFIELSGSTYAGTTCCRHALYYGRAAETVEWFAKLGYTLPYRVNTADFILDLASADVSSEKRCAVPVFLQ